MNDDELKELFSAFDEVSAPDSMKSAAIDNILAMAAAGAAAGGAAVGAAVQGAEVAEAAVASEGVAEAATPTFTAVSGKKRTRSKWHAVRAAAVAACLTMALVGGGAYALETTPTSFVTITQGDVTVELAANWRGEVIANTGNEAAVAILDGVELSGKSLDESITLVTDTLKQSNPTERIEIVDKATSEIVAVEVDPASESEGVGEAPSEVDVSTDKPEASSNVSEEQTRYTEEGTTTILLPGSPVMSADDDSTYEYQYNTVTPSGEGTSSNGDPEPQPGSTTDPGTGGGHQPGTDSPGQPDTPTPQQPSTDNPGTSDTPETPAVDPADDTPSEPAEPVNEPVVEPVEPTEPAEPAEPVVEPVEEPVVVEEIIDTDTGSGSGSGSGTTRPPKRYNSI